MNTHIVLPQPPDPAQAVKAYQGCRARAEQQLRDAETDDDRQMAQFWIDNADRQLLRWLAVLERTVQA